MSDLPVQHYLDIYWTRLEIAEKGITRPAPRVVAGMKRLVSALQSMRPDAKVSLEVQPHRYRFIAVDTGHLIAEIEFDENAEQDAPANAG